MVTIDHHVLTPIPFPNSAGNYSNTVRHTDSHLLSKGHVVCASPPPPPPSSCAQKRPRRPRHGTGAHDYLFLFAAIVLIQIPHQRTYEAQHMLRDLAMGGRSPLASAPAPLTDTFPRRTDHHGAANHDEERPKHSFYE